jgi:hypothetical protein
MDSVRALIWPPSSGKRNSKSVKWDLNLRSEAETFVILCDLLSNSESKPFPTTPNSLTEQDWNGLLVLAKRHRVAPALWRSLDRSRTTGAMPNKVRESLKNIYLLNQRRNRIIRTQTLDVASILNAHGITPILLKTVANILESPPNDAATWITRDIDLLVQESEFLLAADILRVHGYSAGAEIYGVAHSYPALSKPGELVSVDLHRDLGPQRKLLSAGEAFARAEAPVGLQCDIKVLNPSDRIFHLLFHAEIQDRRYELGQISLHQLINFRYLVERFASRVDWEEIGVRFERARRSRILPSYCYMAEQLLGISRTEFPPINWRAKLHYQRCKVQLRSPFLQSAMAMWETLTPHMSQMTIEYLAGDSGPLFRMQHRLSFALRAWRRNGFNLFRKIQQLQSFRVRRR